MVKADFNQSKKDLHLLYSYHNNLLGKRIPLRTLDNVEENDLPLLQFQATLLLADTLLGVWEELRIR